MPKRAIILGGGGARGPYQIGVWRALRENNIEYSIVTGSSVGALNGALMVQGNYETAYALWAEMTTADVIAEAPVVDSAGSSAAVHALMWKAAREGGLDISPLEQKVRSAVDEQAVRRSPVDFGIVTTKYPLMQPVQLLKEEIPAGEMVDYLLASSSWFPFFRRKTIGESEYIDGAYADNLPAELALRCGAEEIIAVDLQGTGIVHHYRGKVPILHIRSHWSLGEMLIFDPVMSHRNMELGYLDTQKALRNLEGNVYAFLPGETRSNLLRLRRPLENIRQRTGVSLLKLRERIPRIQHTRRYRSLDNRFLVPAKTRVTPGLALTTAAEICGELLQVPPDRTYRLSEFNRLLRQQAGLEGGGQDALFTLQEASARQADQRSRRILFRLLQQLREGYQSEHISDRFWGMAAVAPCEFVAANYLLALELHYGAMD